MYRAERAGYSVSGKAKVFGQNGAAVTVRLMQNGTEIAAAETVNGTYTFSGVLPGTYRIAFSCGGYATENRTVEVKGGLAVPDVVLYLLGDLNKDGSVTDADAIRLLMYTFFSEQYPIEQPCDYNKDGCVTDADAIWLLMYTFFPKQYPLG